MCINRALKAIIMALVALLLLNCTGCWDRRELNQITVVSMIGFDRVVRAGKPRIVLSMFTLRLNATGTGATGGGAGAGSAAMPSGFGMVQAVEGETIEDALSNSGLRSPRRPFLGHTQVIVIGEQLAREGIQQVIDFCDRNKDIRYRTDVAVCQGSALEALESQPEYEMLSSTETSRIIRINRLYSSRTIPADLFHVVYGLLTPGRDVAMPRIHLLIPPERGSVIRKGAPNAESEESGRQGQQGQQGQQTRQGGAGEPGQQGSTGTPGQQGQAGAKDKNLNQVLGVQESPHPDRKTMAVDGSAVFSSDKLAGWLNEEESEGAMFITRQAAGGVIPFAFRSSEPNASFFYRRVRVGIKPVVNQDGITFEVNIKGSGELAEDKNAAIDVMKSSDIKTAERLIDAEAEHYCQEAVARCQSLESDVFGFGDLLHKSDPTFWRQIRDQWRDYFPTVKVRVTANFIIEQAGVVGEAIKVK